MSKDIKSVYFIDPTCPKSFVFDDLKTEAIAGTESSTLRLAKALAKTGIEVHLFQNNRSGNVRDKHGIRYSKLSELSQVQAPSHVVLIRKRRWLSKVDRIFPKAKRFYWLHEFVHSSMLLSRFRLRSWTVVGVSKTHAEQIRSVSSKPWLDAALGALKVKAIYNSVDMHGFKPSEALAKDSEVKLVFFSSPHKGLDQVLSVFKKVQEVIPQARLYIANPGYQKSQAELPGGVHNLGSLTKKELFEHVASAFCVFYPQSSFAETFGLIYVEANALGTPVLCADIGAAAEILSNPDSQIVVPPTPENFVRTLQGWVENGRPQISGRIFTTKAALEQWIQAFADA